MLFFAETVHPLPRGPIYQQPLRKGSETKHNIKENLSLKNKFVNHKRKKAKAFFFNGKTPWEAFSFFGSGFKFSSAFCAWLFYPTGWIFQSTMIFMKPNKNPFKNQGSKSGFNLSPYVTYGLPKKKTCRATYVAFLIMHIGFFEPLCCFLTWPKSTQGKHGLRFGVECKKIQNGFL